MPLITLAENALHFQGIDGFAEQTRDAIACHSVDLGKETTDEDIPIRLHRDNSDRPIRARPWIESLVRPAVLVQSGQVSAFEAAELVIEGSADNHFVITLNRRGKTVGRVPHGIEIRKALAVGSKDAQP